MTDSDQHYEGEARALRQIGQILVRAELPQVEVRLPRELAQQALEAWQRDDEGPVPTDETHEQRVARHRAGTLALIGCAIEDSGEWSENEVLFPLDPVFIGLAVDAAD